MSKNNLLISDEDRYGKSSPAMALPSGKGDSKKAKQGVTVTLYGPQVDAFCACSLEVGTKGKATVEFVVKAVSQGDRYGSDVPSSDKPKEVTILLTGAEPMDGDDDEAEAGHEEGETAGKEKEEKAEKPDDEGQDEPKAPATEEPKTKRKSVSPKDAKLED